MSSSNPPSENRSKQSSDEDLTYLERKYGKEPKISAKELARIRWNWH
jgi:hypothetical protein